MEDIMTQAAAQLTPSVTLAAPQAHADRLATAGLAIATPSRRARRAGHIVGGLIAALLLMDATMKALEVELALKGTAELGYPAGVVFAIGLIELVCLVAFLIPRTAVLGAILWTGFLGGAVATHVRIEHPLFSHTLVPVFVATLLWGSLWLRDARVRALLPLRAPARG
jgi:hypothetical protein